MRIADKTSEALQLTLWESPAASTEPRLRFSLRARRVAIRVHEDASVELVVPRGVSERRARLFLESRAEWVRSQVAKRHARARPVCAFPPATIGLSALGEHWRIHVSGGRGRPRIVEGAAGLLCLSGEGSAPLWRHCLRRWLATRAHQAFEPLLGALAQQHGFSWRRLAIRSQRTRWGSCSTRGTISINLAMLFQEPQVLRYLLCHELSHTRHMNHSPAFWRCVAECEPRFRELDRELLQGWRRVPAWLVETFAGGA